MKKNVLNKIKKVLNKNKIKLSYDDFKQKLYVNDNPYTDKSLKNQLWYLEIKTSISETNDKIVVPYIIYISQENRFNSQDIKIKKQSEKEAEKEAKQAQKQAEKEAKQAQKQAEREAKQAEKAEKEARRIKNEQEIENKLNQFIDDFDYNVLESVPSSQHIDLIKVMMNKNGIPIKPIIYKTILSKYKLGKSIKEKEKYQSIGYILNNDNKPDNSLPVNYEVFFDNYFLSKEQWDNLSDKSNNDGHGYCYFDKWGNKMFIYLNNKFENCTPERMRNIVRQYSPLNNMYIVNDLWEDWLRNNREGTYLKDYLESLEWDGVDRLGLNMEDNNVNNNNNIFCEVLGIKQTNLNKKMINYSMLHACRQILWPTRYNFQHILSLVGDTNIGKTKVLQDFFTFPGGIYYCEGVDISGPAWTWGARLMEVVANIWNEKKGINAASNESIKNFLDIVNGQIVFQPKNKNDFVNEPSHNICFITYNPKQGPLLTDYSVSYEKRYFIVLCEQNAQTFINVYLNTINENKAQLWAQLYKWCVNNQDSINELSKEEVDELKIIQKQNKGISSDDVEEKLNYWLNIKKYNASKILDYDQILASEKDNNNYDKKNLEVISENAIKDLLKSNKINFDSRHRSYINDEMYERLGWQKKVSKIENRPVRALVRIKDGQLSLNI